MLTYLGNLLKIARGDFTLDPHIAVYYVTMQCNLNCAYCEDFGSRRNHLVTPAPPLEDAKHILKVIRTGVDRLWLTGGEPLMHPQILELLQYAREELRFKEISLITNGTLLGNVVASLREAISTNDGIASPHLHLRAVQVSARNDILSYLDNLIISLDSVDPQALNTVSVPDACRDGHCQRARSRIPAKRI